TTILPDLACLFMNRREAAALSGGDAASDPERLAKTLAERQLTAGVITAGRETGIGFDPSGSFARAPPPPRAAADSTGAGDALAGATVAALMHGKPLREAMREGMAAALLTIEMPAAVAVYDKAAFAKALSLVPPAIDVA